MLYITRLAMMDKIQAISYQIADMQKQLDELQVVKEKEEEKVDDGVKKSSGACELHIDLNKFNRVVVG